jgi:hypothetical protein
MLPVERRAWQVHRQTTRQSKRRSLVVAAAGPLLLHGDVYSMSDLSILVQPLTTLSYLSGG